MIWDRHTRFLVKSAYQKVNFLISQPKHMLWILKRTLEFILVMMALGINRLVISKKRLGQE